MKKILKFKFNEKEGFLSVVDHNQKLYALALKDTLKVQTIRKTKKLLISSDLKNPDYKEMTVRVSFEKDIISMVYKMLEEANNLYFKTLDDTLCVLEIEKDNT